MLKRIRGPWNGYILLRRFRKTTFSCGHQFPLQGKTEGFKWDFSTAKAREMICHDCYLSKSIPCCFCGEKIFPGDPVALYSKETPNLHEGSIIVGENVIGCMRWDCCTFGVFFAGYWTENGFEPAFEEGNTAVDEVIRAIQAGNTLVMKF